MRLQIRHRTPNQLGTINLPSRRFQTSLYRADRLAVGQGVVLYLVLLGLATVNDCFIL